MFAALGRTVYRFRRAIVIVGLLVALAMASQAWGISSSLSPGGFLDDTSESQRVAQRLEAEFGDGGSTLVVVFIGQPGSDARSHAFQAAIGASLEPLLADPVVSSATGYAELPDDRFIALDGAAAFVVVDLAVSAARAVAHVDRLRALLAPIEDVEVAVTGISALARDAAVVTARDVERAELLSLPLALVILVAVFASLVAAAMPLLVAGLAIPTTLGLVAVLARQTEMSVYVLNVTSMLGLALAIDYSLFLVSRFREELAGGHEVSAAVERAVATVGKAVVFSALAVAIGLSGLLLFESSALTSIGVAGIIVVTASATFAVTFLPALLGMLGPRLNALRVTALLRRIGLLGRLLRDRPERRSAARWRRLATWVMAHPLLVLVPTLAFLLLLGLPFLHIRQAVPDALAFPRGMESRDGLVTIQREFPPGETSPLTILADVTGEPTETANVSALAGYADRLAAVDGVRRVDGPFSGLDDPLSGEPLSLAQLALAYREPAFADLLRPLLDRYVRGSTVRLEVVTSLEASSPDLARLVSDVRALEAGRGIRTSVGGAYASSIDFLGGMEERIPWMLATVVLGMLVALFLLFGSVVLPIKAVLMTLISLTASFGALVWIFQSGNLGGLLGFEALGYTVAGTPIIMFAIVVGLSMDYEVLMLSRIRESYERSRDNTQAVADGLARTAGVITGAALIMIVVFASFALADIVTIKALGVGMAIAVALDATIVRMLLVPATMRLLGRWNWWAPGPLRWLAERAGFSHVEIDDARSGMPSHPGRGRTAEVRR